MDYGNHEIRAWLLRRKVKVKDIEGAYLIQRGYRTVMRCCHA